MLGQNIGKYRVLDRIGRGGMGTVYRAIDETLRREVAIKVLNAELNDPEVARRFRAEAITVARLNHPGIATIYELFQHEGQWLMVMEFVRGETLEHMAGRLGTISPQRAAEICMQCLAALAHAHSMGVVHRDLKPANLMITDETGAIKVMDFGIARVAGTEHLTSAGYMMGTPAYMAPEQVTGLEVDARADLYALGVVFYRLTAGRLPFSGDTPFAMAQSQVNDPPTPIGAVRSDLPPWVEQVLVRALAKSPEGRFQSSIEFHDALARCLAGLPMTALSTPSAETEMLMTPSRAMPTGGISRPMTWPPLRSPVAPASARSSDQHPSSGPPPIPTSSERLPTSTASGPASAPVKVAAAVTTAGRSPLVPLIAASLVVLLAVAGGAWWWRSRQLPAATGAQSTSAGDTAPPGPAPPSEPPPPPTPAPGAAVSTAAAPAGSGATPAPPTSGLPPGRDNTASTAARGLASTALPPLGATAPPAAAAGAKPPPAGPGAAEDAQLAFTDGRVMIVSGKRTTDEEIVLTFGNGQVSLIGRRGGTAIAAVPYKAVLHVTFVRGRDPKWSPTHFSPPDGLDVGSFMRTTKNWLVLQMKDTFLILRLDDSNVSRVLQTIEARTGLTIDRPRADDKGK